MSYVSKQQQTRRQCACAVKFKANLTRDCDSLSYFIYFKFIYLFIHSQEINIYNLDHFDICTGPLASMKWVPQSKLLKALLLLQAPVSSQHYSNVT